MTRRNTLAIIDRKERGPRVLTWTERVKQRRENIEKNIPWWVNDKLVLSKFCHENGLPFPHEFARWQHPTEIDLRSAPDQFVLKPSVMSSMIGVMALTRTGSDSFRESLTRRELTEEAVKTEQISVYEKCKYKGSYKIFVEEWIKDEHPEVNVPFDYKFFCFYDKIGLVQQVDRNKAKVGYAWFDGDFNPIGSDHVEMDLNLVEAIPHIKPSIATEMLKVAERTTKLLKTPFMRVDMFASTRGPIIGELTASPGAIAIEGYRAQLTPAFNRKLGLEWQKAIERLENIN